MASALPKPQQLAETGERTSMLQEFVLTQLLRRSAALDVHTQTHTQEGLEFFTKLLRLLQPWRSVRGDQVQCLERLFV